MEMPKALNLLLDGQDLSPDQMHAVMHLIMTGKATPAQIAGFLIALRLKGETVSEIAAAANVMRELATPVTITGQHVIDTCGTGGDGANTFNISTTVAFVVAAAGGQVAKHGNRSVSSRSGSADVLEAAGINLDLSAAQVSQCVNAIGIGFLFAPKHHSAMKHTIGPRKEMAVRTIFNLLGPLSNPAGAKNQLIGVFSEQWVEPLAQVLHKLGSEHVLIVNAEDGLDEISINSATTVAELQHGQVRTFSITPEQFGFQRAPLSTLTVDSIQSSLNTLKKVLKGEPGPATDIVCLNAGAAIYAANLTNTLDSGIQKAQHIIDNGLAFEKLEQLCLISNRL
ncbi:MAG TPA: anthranilate phosphoribosyltransferase [Methylococcaceae bacterium]|jgi:anthranilate phosphoribosyltransferase|nr:anthranilate phosphoribosyltransferase [Methylococcaceae bacterium]HIN67875.1 anthranilate phosphoribosyltransferase [Methylococcales bacterium]HIA45320.1 anthranilate phosphoribosyltransferase [Methylococcaceae bacterium]HIB62872.1 anthranilate phosphoribosyltransferase [Methylococcaceae bacterium]HIO13100.1 anthranilate phosphoribosyltransferase [Methylococcales bacterium]